MRKINKNIVVLALLALTTLSFIPGMASAQCPPPINMKCSYGATTSTATISMGSVTTSTAVTLAQLSFTLSNPATGLVTTVPVFAQGKLLPFAYTYLGNAAVVKANISAICRDNGLSVHPMEVELYCPAPAVPTAIPTATPTRTPTPTATPTFTPTPDAPAKICHIPNHDTTKINEAITMMVPSSTVADHLSHGDTLGDCPTDCMGVPYGHATVDLCGVCGGDNSTCEDCAGTPNGDARIDVCGVCGGDGQSCAGCDGVPNSQKVIDACGICGGDSSSCKDCHGIPNGGAQIDQCGVCGGDNSSCRDCAGTLNGAARIDKCGLCTTTPTVGECPGTSSCNGTVDLCGVCNGNNACLDCAGIPNGGNKLDCCGVCGGDGSSCASNCKTYEVASSKKKILRETSKLLSIVRKYSSDEVRCNPSRKAKSVKRISLAVSLTKANEKLLAVLKTKTIKICDTKYCKKISLKSILSTTKTNINKLYNLSRESQYAAGVACHAPVRKGESNHAADTARNGANSGINSIPSQKCE